MNFFQNKKKEDDFEYIPNYTHVRLYSMHQTSAKHKFSPKYENPLNSTIDIVCFAISPQKSHVHFIEHTILLKAIRYFLQKRYFHVIPQNAVQQYSIKPFTCTLFFLLEAVYNGNKSTTNEPFLFSTTRPSALGYRYKSLEHYRKRQRKILYGIETAKKNCKLLEHLNSRKETNKPDRRKN